MGLGCGHQWFFAMGACIRLVACRTALAWLACSHQGVQTSHPHCVAISPSKPRTTMGLRFNSLTLVAHPKHSTLHPKCEVAL